MKPFVAKAAFLLSAVFWISAAVIVALWTTAAIARRH